MTHNNISIYQQRIGCTIHALVGEIQQAISTVVKNPMIAFRVKDSETLQKKMKLKNTENVFLINDVYGIRIIVESVEEAYKVLKNVKMEFPGYLDRDYIREPKVCLSEPNKGKLLRLLKFIAYKNGVPFEVQITTTAFHEVNEPLHEGYHRQKYHSGL